PNHGVPVNTPAGSGSGRDMFYHFTAPADATYSFTVDSIGDPVAMLLSGSCGTLVVEDFVDGGGVGASETATRAMLMGEDIYFVPRQYTAGGTEAFTITIDVVAGPSDNDECTG